MTSARKRPKIPKVLVNYEQAYDGEWYQIPLREDNYDQCCDCGLVHKSKYRVIDKDGNTIQGARILTVTWREKRSTAAVRRNFKFGKGARVVHTLPPQEPIITTTDTSGNITFYPTQQKDEPGLRYDSGKLRYKLLPADALEELVRVYTRGAVKYEPRNWEKGMSWSRVFGSLLRHAWAFWRGESIDPETGCHHMAMAAWDCMTILAYCLRGVGTDDRPNHG